MKYFFSLLIFSSLLFAQQKLIVDAQNFEANDKKGITSFWGNVKMKMGKDKLSGDKINIYFTSKNGKKTPEKFIATGNVDFNIVTKIKHYIGKGNKIIYSPSKQEYTVIGNGYLAEKNSDRKIYGDKIYINQVSGEAKVSGKKDRPVRFIINLGDSKENKK